MNKQQKEYTTKTLLDIAKAIIIAFVIGTFIPNSPVEAYHAIWGALIAIILYIISMLLIGGRNESN